MIILYLIVYSAVAPTVALYNYIKINFGYDMVGCWIQDYVIVMNLFIFLYLSNSNQKVNNQRYPPKEKPNIPKYFMTKIAHHTMNL